MEIYTGPEQRPTDIYMMPGTAPNTHLTYVPQFEEVDYMGSDMASEYIYDQGLYYPTANYYGYYSGFESPGEWDDHSSFFGADGQDPRYSSLQAESSSYVYYTPSYGYTQSPYNPYNPYIPGAAIGLDVPYFGTQQYVTNPSYQTPVSSAAYVPVIQPSTDVSNSTQSPSLVSTAAAMSGRHVNVSAKYTPPLASINVAAKTQRSASGNPTPETSQASQSRAKSSEGLLANVPSNKQSLLPLGSTTHAAQARNSSGSVQASNHLSHGRGSTMPNPIKNTAPSNDSFPQYGSNIRGWATADKFRPRLQFYGDLSNPSGGTDTSGEQNRGPRTNKSKWTPAVVDGVIASKSGSSIAQQSIVISADQYNRDDFPVSYPDAKFFVIKSYSEDDVHKSIKYKVWSSTSNGNKRLDSAYQDAQRISVGQRRNCPIFLFFSVNASGQFCGVAEMIGPVEFDKDMDFWQQDKWTGSFPVKWHIIKDVPNTSFRHIILENNENKPVTNSRDTQEIPYLPGLNMLNIFKGTIVKTSILDDFMFYEDRESIMQEEKARLHGRSYDGSQFLRAVVPISQSGGAVSDPCQAEDTNGILNKSLTANEKLLTSASSQPAKADGMPLLLNGTVVQPSSTTRKPPNGAVNHQMAEADGRPPNIVIRSPLKAGGRGHGKTVNHAVDHPAKADGKSTNIAVDQSPSIPISSSTTPVEPPIADKNSSKLKDPKNIADKPGTSDPMDAKNTGDRPSNPMDKDSSKHNNMKSISDEPAMSERKDKKNTSDQRPSKPKDSTGTKWIAYEPQKYVLKDTKKTSDHRPSKLKDSSSSMPKGPKAATRKESETSGDQPPNVHGNDTKGIGTQHSKADRITSKPQDQVIRKLDSIIPNNDRGDPKQKYALHAGGKNSHAVASKGESSSSGVTDTTSNPMNVVTIGSVPISVKGLVESSSGVITVGTIPIEPKSSKYRQGASSGSLPIKK